MAIYKPQPRSANLVNCPLCGVGMPRGRRKCEHCGNVMQSGTKAIPQNTETSEFLGNAIIAVPVIASILALLWIGRMSILSAPFSKLVILAVAVVGITAILGIVESVTTQASAPEEATGPASYGPVHWLLLLTVGWIVGLPLYMRARAFRGLKNQFTAGAAVMGIFLSAILGVGWHIKSKEAATIAQVREMERLEHQYAEAARPPAAVSDAITASEKAEAPSAVPAVATADVAAPAVVSTATPPDVPTAAPVADPATAPSEDSFAALAAEVGVEKTAETATIPAVPSEETPD